MPYPKEGDLVEIIGGKSARQRQHIGKIGTVLRIRPARYSGFKCFWTRLEGQEKEICFSGNDLLTVGHSKKQPCSNPMH